MKRLMLGCAVALPLTLACDSRPTPDTQNLARAGADAELLAGEEDLVVAGRAADPDAPGCDGDCDCDKGEPDEQIAAKPGISTTLDAAALAQLDTTGRAIRGSEDAKVSIIVFSDFECPFCAKLLPTLEEALQTYGDDVSLTFKQMPLPMHKSAETAARASLAAGRQGKFWAMHDALFENPTQVRKGDFEALATLLELDVEQFRRDMDDPEIASEVARDSEDAKALGIRGTPSMVIGDQLVVGAQPIKGILGVIDDQLAES